jgi:tRNA threonylcarbamoyl adenosine modification protein YeaZ
VTKSYGLALHTTSPELGLAIRDFAGNSRTQVWDLGRSLSTELHQYLAEFIQPQTWADLGFMAVAKGPGSFTGMRIGIVTVRTLAQQLEIPVYAISSLAIAAWTLAKEKAEEKAIAIQMPAQREQLFAAIYQPSESGLITLLADTVLTAESWQQTLDNWPEPYQLMVVGDKLGTDVTSLLELAYLNWEQGERPHWSAALPFYGQHPVVEKSPTLG